MLYVGQQPVNSSFPAAQPLQDDISRIVAASRLTNSRADDQFDLDRSDVSQETLTSGKPPSVAPGEVQAKRRESRKIISFSSTDQDNPYNWPRWRKLRIFFSGIAAVMNASCFFLLAGLANRLMEMCRVQCLHRCRAEPLILSPSIST